MKKAYLIQMIMVCFVGIGALCGGLMGIIDPTGETFGIPTDMLKKGPFTDFFIPGLFLFFVIGVGHLSAFVFVKRKLPFHVYVSGGVGCILMGWILIQCYILQAYNFLHIIFFLLGAIEGLIALYMLVKRRLFPFSSQWG